MMDNSGWLFSDQALKKTPSMSRGLSLADERSSRTEAYNIIRNVGGRMGIKSNPTLATAGVFMHRFYMFHPVQDYPVELTSLGCLMLAGKVEETPKKCFSIVLVANDAYPHYYGDLDVVQTEVASIERMMLSTLELDFVVDHPYNYITDYIEMHNLPKDVAKQYVETAYTFANDSYCSLTCLKWEPQVLAISMLHLAFKMKYVENHTFIAVEDWWNRFVIGLTDKNIEQVCHEILNIYSKENSK